MYIPNIEEALQDTKRGPIRKSRILTGMFVIAVIWIVSDLAFLGYVFFSEITIETLKILMAITILTPALGLFYFVFGYLRRYRFLLGKTVEKTGLSILTVAVINMVACVILNGIV